MRFSFHRHFKVFHAGCVCSMLCLFYSDLDECTTHTHNCDVNADCINSVGSYSCKCNAGYTGDGQICSGKRQTKTPTSQETNKNTFSKKYMGNQDLAFFISFKIAGLLTSTKILLDVLSIMSFKLHCPISNTLRITV